MLAPDRRLFEADLQSAAYRSGVAKGLWGGAEADAQPDDAIWPRAFFWMAAASRTGAPDRYYLALNLSGYRSVPPTGPFWDPVKKQVLELGKWPKGKSGQPLRYGVPHRRLFRGGAGLLSPLRPRAGQRPSAVADRAAASYLDRFPHHRELPRRVSIAC